jgi:hypothetical protein
MGPEFNELWNRYFKDKPDKPVMFGSIVSGGKYLKVTKWLTQN